MARKSKLERFAELDSFPNVFQCTDPDSHQVRNYRNEYMDMQGSWSEKAFQNGRPLILELACGKGEYTVALGQAHPENNYIGIDIKGNRMHRGAKKAISLQLNNVAFLRIRIEWILKHFGEKELDQIWITFPDPFLKKSKSNRRLTSPMFQEHYRQLLKSQGVVHLKTDSQELYEFTLETLSETKNIRIMSQSEDIDRDGLTKDDLLIQTYYESQHREVGKTIKYISWQYI